MESLDWSVQCDSFRDALLDGDARRAESLARGVLAQGASADDFLSCCVTPVMQEVGRRFEELEIFLPEMVLAAEVVQEVNERVLVPALTTTDSAPARGRGRVLLATVQGDLHDIGKSMVGVMLSANGFGVVDMGTDCPPAAIVERAVREDVDIVGLSSLLTSCLPFMKDVVELLRAQGLRGRFGVVIGGAAATKEYAKAIGVDAEGHSAAEAVSICRELMRLKEQAAIVPQEAT